MNAPRCYAYHQAATLKGKHHDSAALHHRARICELKQGRKERTGIRWFFLMENIFFPFAFRMVTRAKAYLVSGRPSLRLRPSTSRTLSRRPDVQGATKLFLPMGKEEAEEKLLCTDPLTACHCPGSQACVKREKNSPLGMPATRQATSKKFSFDIPNSKQKGCKSNDIND